jgi:hypothetical protein
LDAKGHPVASGMYSYRVSSGSEQSTRKLMLVR